MTGAERTYIAQRIRETLGPEVIAHMASLGLDVETTLRMNALGDLFVDVIAKARKQGRRAGLKRADVRAAVQRGRRRT